MASTSSSYKAGADPANPSLAIAVRGLGKSFGSRVALRDLDVEVRRGEALGLLGPNGAGKTTAIRILSTSTARDLGEVRVLGLDPSRDATELRARIGVVPQEIALYDELTARENLEFFARMQGVARTRSNERVTWALTAAGLADRASDLVKTFSGGMKRRLNIVTALLHEPELVFLDEPTVGVDPQSRNHVHELVANLRAKGTTLVYTTHQLGEVERLCDRIVILDRGHAIASGSLADLQSRVPARGGRRLALSSADRAEEARALLMAHGIEARVESELPGLEEVFLALTGHALRDGGAA